MWYDIRKTLSHNALINQVIGARGCGKTYGLKKRVIENFIKKGEKFIYLRRYQSELDLVKKTLFSDIILNNEFELEIEFCEGEYRYGNAPCGYPIALSRANHYKSASFPDVTTIIFDEFIIDLSQNTHYLKNEVRRFLDFLETVIRLRNNVKVFLLANSLSFVNPYSLYWNLKKPQGNKNYVKAVDGLVLLELLEDSEFSDAKKLTTFGKLNAGTDYEKFSVENEFILDSDTFIEQKHQKSKYVFTIDFDTVIFGVWFFNSVYYICTQFDPCCKLSYAVSLDAHNQNTHLILSARRGLFPALISAFKYGRVRFDSIQTKTLMYTFLKNSF